MRAYKKKIRCKVEIEKKKIETKLPYTHRYFVCGNLQQTAEVNAQKQAI